MLETAIEAAYAAGKLLRQNFGAPPVVNEASHHDIKLELDVQAQKIITKIILADFPQHAILGEEGVSGPADADVRWVIDPLDGTVNYFYGVPYYAVSIAAQVRVVGRVPSRGGDHGATSGDVAYNDTWQTVAGAVYAPELDEMFAAKRGETPTLNGRPIHVSDRTKLSEAMICVAFFKSEETIRRGLEDFQRLTRQARKTRLMGSAALDTVYVACGRFDAFIEYGIKLWDICAGQLILEQAGGRVEAEAGVEPHSFNVRMTNGKLGLDLDA